MAPSTTELSAARHSLAQGFLLPLMVSMASRLLPIYSADALRRRGLLEVTVDLLMVGAHVRVGAEMIGGCGDCRAARGNWVGAEHLRHSPKALCRVPPLLDVSGLVWSYASSRPDMTWRFFTCGVCAPNSTAHLTGYPPQQSAVITTDSRITLRPWDALAISSPSTSAAGIPRDSCSAAKRVRCPGCVATRICFRPWKCDRCAHADDSHASSRPSPQRASKQEVSTWQ
jgi:hypothetical protein